MLRTITLAVAGAAVTALTMLGTTGASASVAGSHVKPAATYGCRTYTAGYCASWQEENTRLVWAVSYTGASAKSNAPVVVQEFSNSRQDQDFIAVNITGLTGPGGGWKRFEYAPNGEVSGLCISDINSSDYTTLRLRPCNNSVFQEWIPTVTDGQGYNGWQSAQDSHAAIQDPSYGEIGQVLNVGPYEASDNQQWQYNNSNAPLS
jgi:hypothetical protein